MRGGGGIGWFPEGGGSAAFAIAEDTFVGGADVGFDAGVVDFFDGLAGGADERDEAELVFNFTDGRKVDVPEIDVRIEKSHAVGVEAVLGAEMADDADFGFFVFFSPAKEELLFGGELVSGDDAGAVEAEEDGGGGFGENAAIQIAADEEDGNFLRNASASAHNLWWQESGQRSEMGGTI